MGSSPSSPFSAIEPIIDCGEAVSKATLTKLDVPRRAPSPAHPDQMGHRQTDHRSGLGFAKHDRRARIGGQVKFGRIDATSHD
jgi:hypothetical protein